jgi:hypothetical protein
MRQVGRAALAGIRNYSCARVEAGTQGAAVPVRAGLSPVIRGRRTKNAALGARPPRPGPIMPVRCGPQAGSRPSRSGAARASGRLVRGSFGGGLGRGCEGMMPASDGTGSRRPRGPGGSVRAITMGWAASASCRASCAGTARVVPSSTHASSRWGSLLSAPLAAGERRAARTMVRSPSLRRLKWSPPPRAGCAPAHSSTCAGCLAGL